MSLVTTDEAKTYLRVDSSDEDALIGVLLSSACRLCADVARLDEEEWAVVDAYETDEDGNVAETDTDLYTETELAGIREVMKAAILYAVAYLFEHREEADHHGLVLTLRNILFAIREGVL